FVGGVGTAHERARFDMNEPLRQRDPFELRELVWMIVPRHRRVLRRGPEVLANSENGDTHALQIVEDRDDLVEALAEPDHDSRLRGDMRPVVTRAVQQLQRPWILAAGARRTVQAWNGLDVVVQHVGAGVEHRIERRVETLKVRNQHLDPAVGYPGARLADGLRENPGTAVGQVI